MRESGTRVGVRNVDLEIRTLPRARGGIVNSRGRRHPVYRERSRRGRALVARDIEVVELRLTHIRALIAAVSRRADRQRRVSRAVVCRRHRLDTVAQHSQITRRESGAARVCVRHIDDKTRLLPRARRRAVDRHSRRDPVVPVFRICQNKQIAVVCIVPYKVNRLHVNLVLISGNEHRPAGRHIVVSTCREIRRSRREINRVRRHHNVISARARAGIDRRRPVEIRRRVVVPRRLRKNRRVGRRYVNLYIGRRLRSKPVVVVIERGGCCRNVTGVILRFYNHIIVRRKFSADRHRRGICIRPRGRLRRRRVRTRVRAEINVILFYPRARRRHRQIRYVGPFEIRCRVFVPQQFIIIYRYKFRGCFVSKHIDRSDIRRRPVDRESPRHCRSGIAGAVGIVELRLTHIRAFVATVCRRAHRQRRVGRAIVRRPACRLHRIAEHTIVTTRET